MKNAMIKGFDIHCDFGVQKRTVRALSPSDTELVSGGSVAAWIITGVIVVVTVASSLECTPADGDILGTLL